MPVGRRTTKLRICLHLREQKSRRIPTALVTVLAIFFGYDQLLFGKGGLIKTVSAEEHLVSSLTPERVRVAIGKVAANAEGMHEELEAQARLLTADGADRMADVRETSDALELVVSDDLWPLPKYREMLFPL
jgi:glutamine synthetase type III